MDTSEIWMVNTKQRDEKKKKRLRNVSVIWMVRNVFDNSVKHKLG